MVNISISPTPPTSIGILNDSITSLNLTSGIDSLYYAINNQLYNGLFFPLIGIVFGLMVFFWQYQKGVPALVSLSQGMLTNTLFYATIYSISLIMGYPLTLMAWYKPFTLLTTFLALLYLFTVTFT